MKLTLTLVLALSLISFTLSGFAYFQQSACRGTQGGNLQIAASGCEYEFRSGSTLDLQNGTTLNMGSITTTGLLKYGSQTGVANDTLVAHGLGTTPTSVLVTFSRGDVMSQSFYVSATNSTSFTVGLVAGPVTTATLYWAAGY